MKRSGLAAIIIASVASLPIGSAQSEGALDAAGLKSLLAGLGYEVKELTAESGKEKYEIVIQTDALKIPIGAEVAPSNNYIWLTVNLGEGADKKSHLELLRTNLSIQPCQFYVTSKNLLMMGLPIDNRGLSPQVLKARLTKISTDVGTTHPIWSK